ncbi:MAG: hypothetical protein RLZZ612_2393 [Pseudomonadota bacterium]|jgi:uncharacterized membrane protein HdeD (DUF308 family)
MKNEFQRSTQFAESRFGDSIQTESRFQYALARKKTRQRWQRAVGVLMLLAGYMSLAITPDVASEWLLVRIVVGFGLLFGGFAVSIGPWVAAIFGDHD